MVALGVALGIFMVFEVWPPPLARLDTVVETALSLPILTLAVLFIAGLTTLPVYAAAAIRTERDRDTFELMCMTLLTPAGILAGKFVNVFGIFLMFTFAVMPLAACALLLIDMPGYVLFSPLVLLLCTGAMFVAAGLFCSITSRSLPRALLGTYAIIALLGGGYMYFLHGGLELYQEHLRRQDRVPSTYIYTALDSLFVLTPPGALLKWEEVSMSRPVSLWSPETLRFALACIQQLFFASVLLCASWWLLARRQKERVIASGSTASKMRLWRTAGKPPRRWLPISDGSSPIFVRELRALRSHFRIISLRTVFLTLAIGILFVSTGLAVQILLEETESLYRETMSVAVLQSWILGLLTVAAMVAPGVSTPLWGRERDQGTREQLVMTLMRPRDIVLGKTAAAFCVAFAIVLVAFLATSPLLALVVQAEEYAVRLSSGAAMILVSILCGIAIGSQASQLRVGTAASVVCSYALCAAYFLVPIFIWTAMLEAYSYDTSNADRARLFPSFGLLLSPAINWVELFEDSSFGSVRPSRFGLPPLAFMAIVLLSHAGFSIALLSDSIRVEGKQKHKEAES